MIKAVEDKIVVVLLKRTQSKGGIVIPDTVTDPQAYGKVISLGEKAKDAGIKEGDVIVSHIRGGMDSVIGHSFVKVLKLDEVYGLLTDEDTLKALEEIELQESKKTNLIHPVS
jgi:co-chaperonin GroES (HSP10)